jgi:hypothetical protein
MGGEGLMASRRARWLGLVATLAACGSPPPPPPPPAPAPARPPEDTFVEGAWGVFPSKRFDLKLPLPTGESWRIDDTRGPWLEARHEGTSSMLIVRKWHGEPRMNRVSCEEQARRRRDLLEVDGASLVEERAVPVPPGFDTVMRVGILATRPGAPIEGFVIAFGGWSRQCFGFVYTTSVASEAQVDELSGRLAAMVEALDRIEFVSELDPAVQR